MNEPHATDTAPDASPATDPAAAPPAGAEAGSSRVVPLRVSEAALGQVQSILSAEPNADDLALRIAVTGVNGVEYAYDLSLEERSLAEPDDLLYAQGDLMVMIPADSVDPLWGASLDLPTTPGQGGLVIRNPNRPDPMANFDIELTGSVSERIEQLLAQQINPSLAAHGGFASLVEVIDADADAAEGGGAGAKAVVTMGGGCQGCAVSAMTLREGIEKAILQHVPEITAVIDATDHNAGENPFYTDA